MTVETIEIQTGADTGAPTASIIVLHGLGADGNDFVPVAQEIDLDAVGEVRYVFPHAPMRPVTINGGYVMRAWYDILGHGVAPARRRSGPAGVAGRWSKRLIDARDRARHRRLAHRADGLLARLRDDLADRPAPCASALPGSWAFPATCRWPPAPLPSAAANHDMPIFLAHGSVRPIIPIARAHRIRDALMALGHPVEWHEYPMEHSVCLEEIAGPQPLVASCAGLPGLRLAEAASDLGSGEARLVAIHLGVGGFDQVEAQPIGQAREVDQHIRCLILDALKPFRLWRMALRFGQPLELGHQFAGLPGERHRQILGRVELLPVACAGEVAQALRELGEAVLRHGISRRGQGAEAEGALGLAGTGAEAGALAPGWPGMTTPAASGISSWMRTPTT